MNDATNPAPIDYHAYVNSIKQRQQQRSLGQRLVHYRGNHTQAEFASLLGIHENTLARYERGERLPNLRFLLLLKQRGVRIDWLLEGLSVGSLSGQ